MSMLRGGASYASQGRISVAGHRAEPNEHGRSMCRGRYSACSGYNCRWWAAVALGGPVSINQPALNTLPHPLPLARGIARLADRSQLPRMRFARTIYVSRLAANCRERTKATSRSREASKYFVFFHRFTIEWIVCPLACLSFLYKTRTLRAVSASRQIGENHLLQSHRRNIVFQ